MRRITDNFFLCCGLIVLFLTVITGCSMSKKETNVTPTPDTEVSKVTGIVMKNDVELSQMQIKELDSDTYGVLNYGAASEFLDAYRQEQDGSEVAPGSILTITYRNRDAKIMSAKIPEDVWEYTDVQKFSFQQDENMMTVAGENYKFDSTTMCFSGDQEIESSEFNTGDVLTVRGIGIKVYSVARTQGHGYIRLKNYSDFLGGYVSVGDRIVLSVAESMLITASEGTYRVTLSKNGVAASKNVTVTADTETVLDFAGYTAVAGNVGQVKFEVDPVGSDMWINGTSVDYSRPIMLNYGKYKVVVSMTGYATYSGILNVEESSKTLRIELEEANDNTSIEEATVEPDATATPSADTNSTSTTTKKIDSKHTITVSAPEGAEVYLDNVYKGMAPCTFTKVIGSQTITLSEAGYVTKSYSVDILDDDNNVKLSFSDLVKDE